MSDYKPHNLPKLMVAPNGSRRMKRDHKHIPMSINEICITARKCFLAGAGAIHFHVEFYPPLRHGDKPKILAGSESMAGVFIMDVLPEDSAKVLRKFMS